MLWEPSVQNLFVLCVLTRSCPTLCSQTDCSLPGSSAHGTPGKNTGVGCHALLQGIFSTRGSNLSLLCLLQVCSLPLAPPEKSIVDSSNYFSSWSGESKKLEAIVGFFFFNTLSLLHNPSIWQLKRKKNLSWVNIIRTIPRAPTISHSFI